MGWVGCGGPVHAKSVAVVHLFPHQPLHHSGSGCHSLSPLSGGQDAHAEAAAEGAAGGAAGSAC